MSALLYSVGLFAFWLVVGRALFAVFAPRFGALRSWLMAPAIGLATTALSLMVLNQAGWPLGRVSWPITATWLALAIAVLIWKRPVVPTRALLPFAAATAVALLWTGWPAIDTGFNWVSYGNDDMINYCLAAERFMDHGFFAVPSKAELAGRDYAAYYYFMHVGNMMRFGAEHIVAWAATLAHRPATQVFMPAILALALTQLLSTGALVLQTGRYRRHSVATVWILAICPLFMLGTLYQLIAQVGGMALLIATLALLTQRWRSVRRIRLVQHSVLPALACAALCIYYPEASPFAVLTFGAYLAIALVKRQLAPVAAIGIVAYTLVGVVLLLRWNLISYVFTLLNQATSTLHTTNLLLSLFPYFLIPTGFSDFFGWMPISIDFAEPFASISIIAGMLLAAALLWQGIKHSVRGTTAALLLVVQVALAIRLYTTGNDFGLYKLAMFMQPAVAAGLAMLVLRPRWRYAPVVLIAVYAVSTMPTALSYTRTSRGLNASGLTELRLASQLGLQLALPADANAQITCGIENVVAAKFAAAALRGRQVAMVARDRFFPDLALDYRDPPLPVMLHPHYTEMAQSLALITWRNESVTTTGTLWRTQFVQPVVNRESDYFLHLADELSPFNKFGRPTTPARSVFVLDRARERPDQLVFVHSGRGNHYYLGDRRRIALYQQEADPFAPGREFNGLGRFLLLRVEQPTKELFLRVAASRTLLPGRTTWKTGALVHAEADQPLGLIGDGAFNLIVGPLRPQYFKGAAYVAIDFADIAEQIRNRRTGLKALYNADVPLDYRRLIGWVRDISALTPAAFNGLQRPSRVARFPQDLVDAEALEFCGLYEDGWMSAQSKVVLRGTPADGCVHLRGIVPELPGSSLGDGTLTVKIGDQAIELPARTGIFDWLLPVADAADSTTVEFHYTSVAHLPGTDGRPTGGRLELLEIEPKLPGSSFDYGTPGSPRLAASGVDQDGWMARTATLLLPAGAARDVTLKFEYPDWSGAGATSLRIEISHTAAPILQPLRPGEYTTAVVHVPASTKPSTLRLIAENDFPLPAPDTRRRTARLLRVELGAAVGTQNATAK
jgi:hypothetical protein